MLILLNDGNCVDISVSHRDTTLIHTDQVRISAFRLQTNDGDNISDTVDLINGLEKFIQRTERRTT